jgi:ATP-dependent Clp protease ATP-binding subunit ClpC
VLLLDEVEKASPYLMNLFLQAFDEGWLTDGRGKKVYLSDAIVIMTSNLGSENFKKFEKPLGFGTKTLGRLPRQVKKRSDEGRGAALLAGVSQSHRRDRRLLAADDGRSAPDREALSRETSPADGATGQVDVTEAAVNLLTKRVYNTAYGARFLKRHIDEKVKLPITTHGVYRRGIRTIQTNTGEHWLDV